jgi:hypothetical protein
VLQVAGKILHAAITWTTANGIQRATLMAAIGCTCLLCLTTWHNVALQVADKILQAAVAQDTAEGVGSGKIPSFTTGYSEGEARLTSPIKAEKQCIS